MNRRSFIKAIPPLALTSMGLDMRASTVSSQTASVEKNSSLRIAVLNDLHHDSPDCDGWFRGVAASVSELNPDICVLAGDLANKGLEASLIAVREIFSAVGCPICAVPGNHDCDVTGDTSLYAKVFPGQLNYSIHISGWQLIFLDTTDGVAWKETQIAEQTLDWLSDSVSTMDDTMPTLVFSHFPLSSSIHMAPLNVDRVWQILAPLSVRAAFCGHFHGQHTVIRPPLVTTNICCARPGVRGNFDDDPRKGFWDINATALTGRLDYRVRLLEGLS